MRTARALAVWTLSGLMAACASGGAPLAHARPVYTVQPHDTLYSIAWRHDIDYRELAKWNHLGADYKLMVGQVLVLAPTAAAAPRPAPGPARVPPAAAVPAAPSVSPALPVSADAPRAAGTLADAAGAQWTWPTDRLSPPRSVPGGGILLFGRLGQDVRAAGSGRVVYTGNGLRGYGNLVIIKHGDSLLTSYAHNRELLVHEGQEVAMGEVIAHMGLGPHQVCALYFEVRVNGKPTDPLKYLAAAH